ncbi:MAG: DNA cytosine methyltransferase [bacterium]|nr:DNA cytosine methyltransferase [Acidimicrobiia bacterium]MCY4649380.1 DNA cytosine methyltransferase [bacterium]
MAVDLFCGTGGLSAGLEAAGCRVVLSVDSDEWALCNGQRRVREL